MSRFFTWRHALLESDISSTTKLVLLVIGCHMNDMGEGAWPKTATVAKRSGLSERTVCTHIALAEEAGWIAQSQIGLGGQKWKRCQYHIKFPSTVVEGTEPDAEGTEPDDKKALKEVQQYKNSSLNSSIEHGLPDWLDKSAWSEWVQHRKEIRKSLTPTTIAKQLKFLANHIPDHAAIIGQSIQHGYTGLFPLKNQTKPKKLSDDYIDPENPPRPGESFPDYHARLRALRGGS